MEIIKQAFADDLQELFKKHGYVGKNDLYQAGAVAQAMAKFKPSCNGLHTQWYVGTGYATWLIDAKANDILRNLVQKIEERNKPYNYNDLDCNLWGKHQIIHKTCFGCDADKYASFYLKEGETVVKQADCERCRGTGIDPEFMDHSYVVYFDNHGHSLCYVLRENSIGWNIHIRRMPYNLSKTKMKHHFDLFCKSSVIDRYDDQDFEYMRYHDSRDKGFEISMSYDNPSKVTKRRGYISQAEANQNAANAISQLIEHFPVVFE